MERDRLTITLKKELLKRLDERVDGSKIRNRSHAVEYILGKYFYPPVSKAVILVGGKGLKMRPFTYEMPKAMLPINGRPVLEHIIENFRRHDVREFVILTGYQGKKIKQYFADGSRFGVKINYIDQGKKETGTAAPLVLVKKEIGERPFFVCYGDVLADIDLNDMIDFHTAGGVLATMALTSVKNPSNWGVVRMQGNKVFSFLEKPAERKDLSHLINAGVYIFERKIFDYIGADAERLEKDIFPVLVKEHNLAGYLFGGKWFDVGNPEIYKRAVKDWNKR